jgi:hypothetical protein
MLLAKCPIETISPFVFFVAIVLMVFRVNHFQTHAISGTLPTCHSRKINDLLIQSDQEGDTGIDGELVWVLSA